MFSLARVSRVGGLAAVLAAALGIATVATSATPAHAQVWFSIGVPTWTYAPPPPPPVVTYSAPAYEYGYPYEYPSYGYTGFYVGSAFGGWRHHWRDWDGDDDD